MNLLIAFNSNKKNILFFSLLFIAIAGFGCQKKEKQVIKNKESSNGIQQLTVLNASFFTHQITKEKIFIAGSDGKIIFKPRESNQWQAAVTTGFDDKINKIASDDTGTRLIAIGENGLIARSENAGLSWQKIPSPTTKTITTITFDNRHQRWIAAGEQALILYSDPAGKEWQQVQLNSPSTISKIIALPTQLIAIGENGLITHSSNGGHDWAMINPITTATLTDVVTNNQLVFISSADGNIIRGNLQTHSWELITTGFTTYLSNIFYDQVKKLLICLSSDGDILLSDDGGNLWAPVSRNNHYLNNLIQSTDNNFLLAVGDQGQLLISNNAGRTWSTQHPPINTNIEGIIPNGNNGFIAYGEFGLLMQLKSPQSEWEIINYPASEFIHQLLPQAQNNWIAIGAKGTVLRSVNQGNSWQPIATPAQEEDYFLSIIEIKKSGKLITAGPPGTILTTNSSADTWRVRLALSDANQGYFHRLVSDNKNTVIAIAGPGTTHYSSDAGENWYPANIDNRKQLFNAIYDEYHQQFIAVGQEGSVQLSHDGKNWTLINTNIASSLQTVYATEHSLWAAGDKGVLIQSTDGGKTWQDANASSPATILTLFETQGKTLLATGVQGYVARWSSHKQQWQPIATPTHSSLRMPVQDKDSGIIYIPGKSGEIIYSKDDGLNWKPLPPVTQGSIKALYIDNPNKMLIGVGERLIRIPLLTRND